MSKEIIEFLKSNRVPYYLWTDEERAVADRIPRKWWMYYMACDSRFMDVSAQDTTLGDDNDGGGVYRLKPDYEPEPESLWTEYDVVIDIDGDYCLTAKGGPCAGKMLRVARDMKGFGGIAYEDCACESMADAGMTGKFWMSPVEPCEKHGPHRPVLVRFWRQK